MKELKGIYNRNSNKLEIYNNNELLINEDVIDPEDYWVGSEINDKPVDFQLWEDNGEENYKLSFYPDVIVDQSGYLSTNTLKSENVQLIII